MISAVIDRTRILVADCQAFQNVVGAASRLAAMEHVIRHYADDDSSDVPEHAMPRAVINFVGNSYEKNRVALGTFASRGTIDITFEFLIPDSVLDGAPSHTHHELRMQWFIEQIDLIEQEMRELSGNGESVEGETHLNIISLSAIEGPYEHPQEEVVVSNESPGQIPYSAWMIYQLEHR